jgi:hypothetical protein
VNIRFPDSLHEAATAAANADRRSLGPWIRIAVEEKLARDSKSARGEIKITDAYLRFDEHGTLHTDAALQIDRSHLDSLAWHGGRRWLCIHEPGNPACPSLSVEALIVGPRAGAFVISSPPSTHTSDGSPESTESAAET